MAANESCARPLPSFRGSEINAARVHNELGVALYHLVIERSASGFARTLNRKGIDYSLQRWALDRTAAKTGFTLTHAHNFVPPRNDEVGPGFLDDLN